MLEEKLNLKSIFHKGYLLYWTIKLFKVVKITLPNLQTRFNNEQL